MPILAPDRLPSTAANCSLLHNLLTVEYSRLAQPQQGLIGGIRGLVTSPKKAAAHAIIFLAYPCKQMPILLLFALLLFQPGIPQAWHFFSRWEIHDYR